MPMKAVDRTTNATRTISGSWRRGAAVPAAAPPAASSPRRDPADHPARAGAHQRRPRLGRPRRHHGGGIGHATIVAPRHPDPTRVITPEEESGSDGGFP